MITRIKEIIAVPKKEWTVIEGENTPHAKLFMSYVLPLSLITAIAAFIGYGLIGYGYSVFGIGIHYHSITWGIRQAIVQWVSVVAGIYLVAFVINFLAETFGAKKDFDKAFSLVAYSYTPMLVAGIFYIFPPLSILAALSGLYGLYILYLGMQPMMKTPADKNTGYFVVSLLVIIIISVVVAAVMGAIMGAILISNFSSIPSL